MRFTKFGKNLITLEAKMMLNSIHFGMTFWLDNDNQLMYCPTFNNNQPDKSNSGYVSEWDDWSHVNYNKLFDIIAQLVTQKEAN